MSNKRGFAAAHVAFNTYCDWNWTGTRFMPTSAKIGIFKIKHFLVAVCRLIEKFYRPNTI